MLPNDFEFNQYPMGLIVSNKWGKSLGSSSIHQVLTC